MVPIWASFFIIFLEPIPTVIGKAILSRQDDRFRRSPPIYDNVQTYLSKFGYLPQSDLETGNLRTDDQLKDAIRHLQRFGNIPATGEVDEKTAELLEKPRCGLPDIYDSTEKRRKRYTLHGQRWDHNNLTWSLQTKNVQGLNLGKVRYELARALRVWEKPSKLTFRETANDDADILVYFHSGYHGDGFPFDGRGQILAHAFFPGTGRGGDAHFDEQELWLVNDEDNIEGTSLFGVAAHEFGHSLGLQHSSVSGSLMFPWYQGANNHFKLPDDDKLAIQDLYGVSEEVVIEKSTETPAVVYTTTKKPPKKVPATTTPDYLPKSPSKPPHRTYPPIKPPRPEGEPPDTCDTSYDAISIIRGDIYIFKDKYMWRISNTGICSGYPNLIDRLWYKLPSNMTHVDAVYERYDQKIVFFIGKYVYLYRGNILVPGYPKPLTFLGLPETLDHIDGAMVWGYNSKTYLFSGTMYWRLDDENGKVELDYPRDMSIWKGVGYNIDCVFQWKDGATYFFKGKGFWKFDDARMRVYNTRQIPSAPFWMACPAVRPNERQIQHLQTKNFTGEQSLQSSSNEKQMRDLQLNNEVSSPSIGCTIYPLFLLVSFLQATVNFSSSF